MKKLLFLIIIFTLLFSISNICYAKDEFCSKTFKIFTNILCVNGYQVMASNNGSQIVQMMEQKETKVNYNGNWIHIYFSVPLKCNCN